MACDGIGFRDTFMRTAVRRQKCNNSQKNSKCIFFLYIPYLTKHFHLSCVKKILAENCCKVLFGVKLCTSLTYAVSLKSLSSTISKLRVSAFCLCTAVNEVCVAVVEQNNFTGICKTFVKLRNSHQ